MGVDAKQGEGGGTIQLGANPEEDMLYGVHVSSCHRDVRVGFLRKVYGIVATQLLLTCASGAVCMGIPAAKAFVQSSPTLFAAAQLLTIATLIATLVHRHSHPLNMQLLALFVRHAHISIHTHTHTMYTITHTRTPDALVANRV
jgi:FtsH-binding integral membrane protein